MTDNHILKTEIIEIDEVTVVERFFEKEDEKLKEVDDDDEADTLKENFIELLKQEFKPPPPLPPVKTNYVRTYKDDFALSFDIFDLFRSHYLQHILQMHRK